MKKWFIVLMTVVMLLGGTSSALAETVRSDMKILLDGQSLDLAKSGYLINNNLYVPFRALAEKTGATVAWDDATRTVTATKEGSTISFEVGARSVQINGTAVPSDVPAVIIDDFSYVPVRFFSETLGIAVGYEEKTRTVTLSRSNAPGFKTVGVKEGDLLYTDKLQVSIVSYNHTLTDFTKTKGAVNGQGHIHLWLDTDVADPKVAVKSFDGKPVVFDQVAPGDHTLTVLLVGNDHRPIVPEVKQVIKFRTAKAPTLAVTGPKQGETIRGTTVAVTTQVTDFQLTDFTKKNQPAEGEGHIHIWLDSDINNPKIAYKQINAEAAVFENVSPGEHTLTVQLVGNNHQPIRPAVKQVITFRTEFSKTYSIEAADFKFSERELTVEAGALITFKNNDSTKHNIVAVDGSFRTPLLDKGETATFRSPSAPGKYEFYCDPHRTFMKGVLIVR